VRSGAALLVHTGWTAHWYAHPSDRASYFTAQPGMSIKTLEWLDDHQVACIAVDNTGVEVKPSEVDGEELPFHLVAIRDLGLTIGEVFDFARWPKTAARIGATRRFLPRRRRRWREDATARRLRSLSSKRRRPTGAARAVIGGNSQWAGLTAKSQS
jgi:hypothetical protein